MNPNSTIVVDPSDMADYHLHGNTDFITSSLEARVRVRREAGSADFNVTINSQAMNRQDIKDLRKFLKQVLANMKADPDDEALK